MRINRTKAEHAARRRKAALAVAGAWEAERSKLQANLDKALLVGDTNGARTAHNSLIVLQLHKPVAKGGRAGYMVSEPEQVRYLGNSPLKDSGWKDDQ